jgi:outer membrane protein assembly factor BamB
VYLPDYQIATGEIRNDPGSRIALTGQERLHCLDAATGKTLWLHAYDAPYKISYPCGPRATPTVADGKVYLLGAEGQLTCLDAVTGTVVWAKALKEAYKTDSPQWGFCGHPLVDGSKLICSVGGPGSGVVAFDKETGKELWRAVSARAPTYCPPSIIQAGGTRQLIVWDPDKLNSLNPENGQAYWSQPLQPGYDMSIMAPQQYGNKLFASGIGRVGALYNLDESKPAATLAWVGTAKSAVYAANATPLIHDGTIYGVDCDTGFLMAVELETGKRLWETAKPYGAERRLNHGTAFLVRHAHGFFLFAETGDLVLAQLSPQEYREISRFHILEPTGECFGRPVVWSHPAFADKCCFVRNDKELVCVSLAE